MRLLRFRFLMIPAEGFDSGNGPPPGVRGSHRWPRFFMLDSG